MKPSIPTLLSLLSLTSASALSSQSRTQGKTSTPTALPSTDTGNTWWQPIPPALQDFIAAFNAAPQDDGSSSPDLRKRQKGIGGAAPEATTTIATQMSPITTYFVNGSPVVFTQTFAPTPDPWSGPVNGQIGMGTIQGAVGTVRSGS